MKAGCGEKGNRESRVAESHRHTPPDTSHYTYTFPTLSEISEFFLSKENRSPTRENSVFALFGIRPINSHKCQHTATHGTQGLYV